MKKIYLLLLLCCVSMTGFAQTAASYIFSQALGTYTNLSSPTAIYTAAGSWDDQATASIAIPFTFTYLGTGYTSVYVCANGHISFGAQSSGYTPLTSNTRVIAGFASDLRYSTGGGDISYQTIGSAPNRVFVVQWLNFCHFSPSNTSGPLNFQIQLYETSNLIKVQYGPFTPTADPNSGYTTMEVGINGASTADFNNRSTTTDWTNTTAGTSNSATCTQTMAILPPNGLTFTWTPPPTAVVAPTSLSFGAVNTGSSAVQSFNLSAIYLNSASGSLTVTAPSGYQVSSTGLAGSWGNTATFAYSSYALATTPVYVQFNPTAVASYPGSVTITGGGLSGTAVTVNGDGAIACSGAPVAGTVVATPAAGGCTATSSFTTTLSLSGTSVVTGLGYQWESSPDNTTWTPIASATNATYSATISTATYYHCIVKCISTSLQNTTAGLLVKPGPSYATLPFFESFESSWTNGCATADIPNNFWRNTTTSAAVNNFWRRQDDPSGANTAGWGNPTLGLYPVAASVGSYSARFHSYQSSSGTHGDMNLYVNLPVGTKQISYDYINTSGTDVIVCQISTDGTTFTTVDAPPAVASTWTNRTFTTTLASPTAIIRFYTTSDFGTTDIGLDNVNVILLAPCTTPNQATALTLTPTLFNIGGSFTASSPVADKYMVIMTTTNVAPANPVSGTNYAVGSTALGGTVIANGTATTFNATGLTSNSPYWFWVYAYNSVCTGGPLYKTPALTGNAFTTSCSLSGTKTIGATGNYPTITAALAAVTNNGLSGPLTLQLQADYSSAGETYPILINNIPCSSATNTLTIKPAAGVAATITNTSSSAAVFKLTNISNIIIDGVNSGGSSLTLNNTNTGASAGVWLASTATTGVGCNNITLTNLTINGGSNTIATDYGIVAVGDAATPSNGSTGGDNDNITISNNTFTKVGYAIFTSGSGAASAGANDNWVVTGNTVGAATYSTTTNAGVNGMFFRNMVNLTVTGNTLQHVGISTSTAFGTAGLYLEQNITRAVVANNNIIEVTTGANSNTFGIYCGTAVINSIISRNNITGCHNDVAAGGTIRGIYFNSSTAATADTIVNNTISDFYARGSGTIANNVIGIGIEGTVSGINVWHNSVNFFGAHAGNNVASPTYALYIIGTGNNLDIRNNIFVNTYDNSSSTTDVGYAVYLGPSVVASQFSFSDFNDIYVSGGINKLARFGTTDFTTLAAIQTASGANLHSVNVNPGFTSNTDLHIPAGTTSQLESGGQNVGVTTDIDGQTRPGPAGSVNGGAQAVDIGADEFDGIIQDVVPPAIAYTALTSACGTADRTITAVITDAKGANTTTLQPRIYFKKNSGSYVSAAGVLASGTATNGTWNFTISTSALGGLAIGDVVSYYIIAQDIASPSNIGATPGAGLVATDVNSVSTPPTTPNTYTVFNSLSGTYNVGAGQTYTTITAAVNAYNNSCLAGPVTFQLMDATYSTSETFPITINKSIYANATNTLTIKPAAGVAASINGGTSSVAIFKLLNAQYVTIDGVNAGGSSLTINNNNTGASATIWLASTSGTGGNNFVAIKNTTIVGGTSTGTTSSWAFLSGVDGASPSTTAGPNNDNITIQGNNVTKAAYGIYAFGTAAVSAGGFDNWTISGNTFGPSAYNATTNIGYNGIYIGSMLNPTISNNTIQNVGTTSLSSQTVGIGLVSNVTGATIDRNNINNITSTASVSGVGSNAGIILGTATTPNSVININVTRNAINGISNVSTGGWGARGIIVNSGVAASNIVIANNSVSDIWSYSDAFPGSFGYWPIGIDIDASTGGVKVYYNSVNLFGSHTGLSGTATGSAAMFLNATGSNIDIRDNIFVNTYDNSSSTTDKGVAIFANTSTSVFSSIDYNDYYAVSPDILGYNGSDRTDLAGIQAGFGGNTHSLNVAPTFVSSTDLHLQSSAPNVPFLNSGTPVSPITIDFNGTVRNSTTPVIGMHEVNIPACGSITPGIATPVNPAICVSGVTTVNAISASAGLGMSYQWQSSPDSVSWTTITGATNTSYVIPTAITANTFYRMVANCSISGNRDSTSVKVRVVPLPTIAVTPDGGAYCSGNSLTMGASGAVSYTWSPSSGLSSTNSSVVTTNAVGTTSYTVTGTDIYGCVNTHVSNVTVTATPPVPTITPGVTAVLCSGGVASFTATTTPSGSYTTSSGPISIAIPDYPVTGTISQLNVSAIPAGATVTGISATFNITHTWDSDLRINLSAPNGNTINFVTLEGGSNDNFTNTTVNSTSTTAFSSGSAPFTGTYSPDAGTGDIGATGYPVNVTSFSSLYSLANGVWTLGVRDMAGGDVGTINSWSITINYTMPPASITWAPNIGLFTDAAATVPYTGSVSSTIYAAPQGATVPTTNTYTAIASNGGCTSSTNVTVTVNPTPGPNTGGHTVCIGSTTTLNNAMTGGTWSTSSPNLSIADNTAGVITGVNVGTGTVTYTLGTGCRRVSTITVNPLPAAIDGNADVCIDATNMLTDATPGGVWSSSATGTATIGSMGALTGVVAGYSNISYTLLTTGCAVGVVATVNVLPVVSITPSASATICNGSSTTFTAATSVVGVSLLSQDFNTDLGSWTITNGPAGDVNTFWQIVPSGSAISPGDGTPMLQSFASASGGVSNSIVTSPSFSTIGYASASLSFNQSVLSDVPDANVSVEYSVNNGAWTSLIDFLNDHTTYTAGTWSAGTPTVTVPLPAPAIGQGNVKLRWHYDGAAFWWQIDNINVSAVPPAATYMWTGTGLSCTACGTTTITPTTVGMNNYSVTATTSHNCMTTIPVTVSVNPMPSAIGGTPVVCETATTQLTNELAGGTWTSSAPTIANVSPTGQVLGVATGTATIVNTQAGGCNTSVVVTVNTTPAPIDGSTMAVCTGSTITLNEAISGGSWSSIVPSTASVNNAGLVTGNFPGTVSIRYTMTGTGCWAATEITVNQTPGPINGPTQVCEGSTIGLGNTLAGGTWSSSNTNALVDVTNGIVTGNSNGISTITYQMLTGCYSTSNINVNVTPAPILGIPMVCENYTTNLSDPTSIGVWTSSNTHALVNNLGVVSGNTAGISTITYTMLNNCYATRDVTVNTTPAPISGIRSVCEGLTTALSSTPLGGTWSTVSGSVATVDPVNGMVTGGTAGITGVSYTLETGCYAADVVTVNPTPAPITGAGTICEGLTTPLNSTSNGGTWSSSSDANATVNAASGVMSGVLAGNVTITYTLPEGCTATKDVTVNPTPAPLSSSTGMFTVCEGAALNMFSAPASGTWSSVNNANATIDGSGSVSGILAGTTDIVYTLPEGCTATQSVTVNPSPSAITGSNEVCEGATTALHNTVAGGTWTSNNTPTATIGASTGIVSGHSAGVSEISYTLPGGCGTNYMMNVYQTPAAISGPAFQMCEGNEISYSSTPAGGIWSSDNTAVALINSAGLTAGVLHGTANITYALAHGCIATAVVTVNATAAPITGTATACEGNASMLNNTVTGGTWSSSNATIASVNATTGLVTAISAGNADITYNMPGGPSCSFMTTFTVNPTPTTIGGSLSVCKTASATLTNTVSGGTWTSTVPTVATINGTTGTLTGVDAGTATVSYATAAGCATASVVTVNVTIPAVTVSQSVSGAICNGTSVTYTANPVNGGTTPTYIWRVNGAATAATGNSYTYTPANGDVVKTVLHSNAACALPDSAVNNITMTIMPNVMPAITVDATPGSNVCKNTPVTFTSTVANGGTSPLLTWVVNGTSVSNANSYTYTPNDHDIVYCVLNSSAACILDTEVYSNNENMSVDPGQIPIVNMTPLDGTSIVKGGTDSIRAFVLNGGTYPKYQWYVNSSAITGATNATFDAPINGGLNGNRDSITVQVIADGPCALSTFNSVVIRVIPLGVAPAPALQSDLRLIPNPNSGEFVVSGTMGSNTDEEVQLEITDMLGQVVYKGQTMSKGGAISERIKLSNTLANGMYMLNVHTANTHDVFHFVLKQ